MPVNPNIALGLEPQKPVDIMGAYGNALTLRNLVDQGKMQSLQLAQAQRESEKQMRLADIARMYGGDEARFNEEYRKVDPLGAREYGIKEAKSKADLFKTRQDTYKAQLDNAEKLNGLRLQSALAVRDAGYSPEAYVQQRERLATILPPELASTIPPMMSREEIDATINAGMSMADRIARERLEYEKNKPASALAQLYADEDTWRRAQGEAANGGSTSDASGVSVAPMPSPYAQRILREKYGAPPEGFQWSESGKPVPMPEVLAQRERERKASASNINVAGGDLALGKPAQGKVDEGLLDTSAALMRVERIGKEYKPEWSTYAKQGEMGFQAFREKLGGKLTPDKQRELASYTSWRASALDNMNRTIKDLTGSAMGVEEAARIMSTLPNPDDSPSQFQRKLEDAKQQTRMALARLTYIKRNGLGMESVPLDRVPSLINDRGAAVEQEIKKKFPSMTAKEVERMTKRQLAQEFGLIAD